MKILILTQYFWPQNYRINLVAEELLKKKFNLIILTSSTNKKDKKRFSNAKIYRVKTYQIRKFKLIETILNYITFYINACIFIIFNSKKLKVDKVLIFQPSPIFIGLLGLLIKKMTKTKIYLWILDLWPDTVFDYKFIKEKSLFGKLLSFITYTIYNNCEKIFIHSAPFRKQVRKYTNAKCIYLPSPAEDIFERNKNYNFDNKKINILFAGNIGQSQTFDDIFKVLNQEKFQNINLTILGDGRKFDDLKKLIKTNNNKNIFLKKRVSLDKVKEYYLNTDFFFLSLVNINTFKKTVPGKFQSYLKFGKPILGVINGETNIIIKKLKCGYVVNNGEIKKLKDILSKIQNLKKSEYNQLCKNGLNAYKKNYDKKLIIDRLIYNLKSV